MMKIHPMLSYCEICLLIMISAAEKHLLVLVLIMSLVVSDIASSEGGFWWHDGAEGFVIGRGESKRSFMNDVFLVERFRRAVG